MLKQFFEQKTAVYTALEAMKNADLIKAVSSVDSDTLQNVIDVLKTFQTATTVISKYSLCTISLILSLQLLLITKWNVQNTEQKVIAQMKAVMQEDMDSRHN